MQRYAGNKYRGRFRGEGVRDLKRVQGREAFVETLMLDLGIWV